MKLYSLCDTLLSSQDLTITQYSLLANIDLAGLPSHAALAEKVGMERTPLTRNLCPLPCRNQPSRKLLQQMKKTVNPRDAQEGDYLCRSWKLMKN
jgi:hypothetical protein